MWTRSDWFPTPTKITASGSDDDESGSVEHGRTSSDFPGTSPADLKQDVSFTAGPGALGTKGDLS